MKKLPTDNNPPYEDQEYCDTCGQQPAADFNGQLLCLQCVHDDVFETMNDNRD